MPIHTGYKHIVICVLAAHAGTMSHDLRKILHHIQPRLACIHMLSNHEMREACVINSQPEYMRRTKLEEIHTSTIFRFEKTE